MENNLTAPIYLSPSSMSTYRQCPQKFKFNSTLKHSFFFSFLELDYYSNSIIILKHFNDVNLKTISTCDFNAFNTQRFINYIKTK